MNEAMATPAKHGDQKQVEKYISRTGYDQAEHWSLGVPGAGQYG